MLLVGTGRHLPGSMLTAVPAVEQTLLDLGRCLIDRAGLESGSLTVLLDPDDPRLFGDALVKAADEADDVLLLYYVGHGLLNVDGELHLATRATMDLTRGIAAHQALPYSTIAEVLAACRAPLLVTMLDCCFAGRATGVPRTGVDSVFAANIGGSYVLAAAGVDEAAWAPDGARHTAFSGALVDLLVNGDPAAGPRLTLDEVYRSLCRTMTAQNRPAPRRHAHDRGDRQPLVLNSAYAADARGVSAEIVPYRGLAPYGMQDADLFFGRSDLVATLIDRVAAQPPRTGPLLLTGPSGVGKSSLLRAGLVPALHRTPQAGAVVFTPTADPFRVLAEQFAELAGCSLAELAQRLYDDPRHLAELLAEAVPQRRVVIIDQFEEIFTLCSVQTRRAFLAAVHAACSAAVVVLAVRADFLGQCMQQEALKDAVSQMIPIFALPPERLRQVIERPAHLAGLAVEASLTDLLIEDTTAAGMDNALPLLSHALLRTWKAGRGSAITVTDYLSTGRVSGALQETADAIIKGLDLDGRQIARRLLTRLVRIGAGAGQDVIDTAQPIPLDELRPAPGTPEREAFQQVLDRFIAARLITVDAHTARIAHEALIHSWPRLREWLATDRAALFRRQQLDQHAREWAAHGHDSSFLYGGTRLDALVDDQARWEEDLRRFGSLPELSANFRHASLKARERASRARRRQRTTVILSLVVALIAATAVAITAVTTARDNDEQRLISLSQKVASDSVRLADLDGNLSRSLAATAYGLSPTTAARHALARAWNDTRRALFVGENPPTLTAVSGRIGGQDVIVTGHDNGTITIWDALHAVRLRTMRSSGAVNSLAWADLPAPTIISGHQSGHMVLWDAQTGQLLQDIETPAELNSLCVSSVSGAPVLVSAHTNGRVYLWTRETATILRTVRTGGIDAQVGCGQVDGSPMIAIGVVIPDKHRGTGRLDIREAATGRLVHSAPTGRVSRLAWAELLGRPVLLEESRIGGNIVTHTAAIWDARRWTILHEQSQRWGTVSPALGELDGRPVLAYGAQGGVQVWDPATDQVVREYKGESNPTEPDTPVVVMWLDGGKSLAAVYRRGVIAVWNPRIKPWRMLESHPPSSLATGLIGGRSVLAVQAWKEPIEVWDLASGKRLRTVDLHSDVYGMEWGELGGQPAIASWLDDDKVIIWSPASGARMNTFKVGAKQRTMAWAQGQLVTGGSDGSLRIWEPGTGRLISEKKGNAAISSLAVGHLDGTTIIAAGYDNGDIILWSPAADIPLRTMTVSGSVDSLAWQDLGTEPVLAVGQFTEGRNNVQLWSSRTGTPLSSLPIPEGLRAVSWSVDGGRPVLVTAKDNNILTTWDPIALVPLNSQTIPYAAGGMLLPVIIDGRPMIVSADLEVLNDTPVQVWDMALPAGLLPKVCQLITRPLSRQEWRIYVGTSEPYRDACHT
ncbi:AAA family ATPase [Nonomuraea spiralis]|uniref:AAA family ATPase n=1 Tax=Nonomuraea spiralis TaxID=46182 RepID=A0ABV5IU68_9ACTN|nr:AAA family ATPase [Nonomuraea spiralis]